MTDPETARAEFDAALGRAGSADEAYRALQRLAETVVGAKLFTVMTVDIAQGVARRAYTSNTESYPASGTKPIHYDEWFRGVSEKRLPFVANTLADISKVFPDFELIGSLGCGSVINLPIFLEGKFVCTVNLLHEEHYYTPDRLALAKGWIVPAAKRLIDRRLPA